jgi:hypothetical protein
MLRHGQLPFWNQYIFSGTPLMADFNAGAFYPLTGLFVVLPDRAAWVATEVVVFAAIAVGMYVFLRALKLSTVACVLAAATYAFAGPVLSQVNHVDMTEGFVAIPWMLLAILHIVRDGRWRWASFSGSPTPRSSWPVRPRRCSTRPSSSPPLPIMSAGLNRERWWRVVTRCGAGAALALSLAAIQWLPGLEAISNSQRGSGVVAAAGSYPRPYALFSLVPYIDGGYGHLGEANFFGQYNLPEVGIYLGILPVDRADHPPQAELAQPASAAGPPHVVRRRALRPPPGPGIEHAPGAPLQQRAPLRAPTAAEPQHDHRGHRDVCPLRRVDRPHGVPRLREPMTRYDRIMGFRPGRGGGRAGCLGAVSPRTLVWRFAGVSLRPLEAVTVREATLIALAFCLGAAALVWIRPRLSRMSWLRLAAVFVAVDVGLMGADQPTDRHTAERPAGRHDAD